MSKTGKVIIWAVVWVLAIWGLSQLGGQEGEPAGTSDEPIKIGFLGPLSGDVANIGENARAAVEIAVAEVNADGGVLGRNIEVVYEDDVCSGASAANAMSKLINTDKVVAVLGAACSGATLAVAPIAEAAGVPELSYCSTNPTVSQAGDFIFRNVPSDLFQADYAAEYLVNSGKGNVAVLTSKDDWGEGLNKAFTDALARAGGSVVSADSFEPTSKDFRTQLTKIKAQGPDAVYFAGYTEASIAGLKQASDIKLDAQIFGADAWDDSKIWSELGSLGDGAMYTVVGTNSSDGFKAKMKEKLGKDDLVYCSNYAYDGLKVLADAIGRAGGTDGVAIKDALYNTKYSGGVSAESLEFDANGDPVSANYIVKVAKDGKTEEAPQ
jgi:branched-chain amino acid transport system substrate-binding protein